MPLLVCHIGWMSHYEGLAWQADDIVGGGRYVKENRFGGEVCNFLRCKDGNVYGHVETVKKTHDRPITIELLGADTDANYADGVTVIWTATHPRERKRRVLGWYHNARVFRTRQHFSKFPSLQHRRDKLNNFRIQARAEDVMLLPVEGRRLRLGRGKGWIGQANWWFLEQSRGRGVSRFVKEVRELVDRPERSIASSLTRRPGGKWGGATDPERSAEVERAAIIAVEKYFSEYAVDTVEAQNLGWDLEATKGKSVLRLEVKGLFGAELQVGLTPREYRAFNAHRNGKMENYRLCVVTKALCAPHLTVFRYYAPRKGWMDERTGRRVAPAIKVLQAAIISLA